MNHTWLKFWRRIRGRRVTVAQCRKVERHVGPCRQSAGEPDPAAVFHWRTFHPADSHLHVLIGLKIKNSSFKFLSLIRSDFNPRFFDMRLVLPRARRVEALKLIFCIFIFIHKRKVMFVLFLSKNQKLPCHNRPIKLEAWKAPRTQ